MGIAADAVVAQAHHPQAFIPPLRNLFGRDDAVSSLHGEHEPQGCGPGIPFPILQVSLQPLPVPDLAQHPLGLHQPIVGQLAAALGVGDILVAHTREAFSHRCDPAGNGNEKEPDVSPALLLVVDHGESPTLLGHARFRFPDPGDALQQVPVPFNGIVSNIDVGIDNQHSMGPPVAGLACPVSPALRPLGGSSLALAPHQFQHIVQPLPGERNEAGSRVASSKVGPVPWPRSARPPGGIASA